MHDSPAFAASWLAIVTAACQTGSRAACAIMLPIHESNGAVVALYSAWQYRQFTDG